MIRFSANLGFLWTDRPLLEAVRAAAAAGFAAVEAHWPYATAPAELRAALAEVGLPLLALNAPKGAAAGDFGLAALPERAQEAHEGVDAAIGYAAAAGARAVHVLAGRAEGPAAREAYLRTLAYAAERAAGYGLEVLIEPINRRDAPGYFLHRLEDAIALLDDLGRSNVRVLADIYHMQIEGGDLTRRLEAHLPRIGHLQIAAAPGRAEPDEGEIAYERLLPRLVAAGYAGFVGAEYRPRGGPAATDAGLRWLRAYAG